jgi:protein transport protein SEC9
MKKFGFGKKGGGDDDDGNRQALFGSRKGGAAPQSDNPYAQQGGQEDPYMAGSPMTSSQAAYRNYQSQPYRPGGGGAQSQGGLPSGPRGGYGAPPPNRSASSASYDTTQSAPPPYNNNNDGGHGGGYGNDRYGASGGYGSNRYDNSGAYGDHKQPTRGAGGYGGLGRTDSDGPDENRDALFSGARERHDQRQTQQQSQPQNDSYGSSGTSGAGGYGDSGYGGSGYGAQRELTAEEQEEEEVAGIRRQIKETKLASANSAENSERIAAQAVETALGTYARLGAQHERLNYTENLLDKASISTREAEGQTRKLKSLNRSMFAVHVGNPFTAKQRDLERERMLLEESQQDRAMMEAGRKAGYQTTQRMEKGFAEIEKARQTDKWQRGTGADKKKYQFEDDSEDDEAEDRIEDSMRRTAGHVHTLNSVAKLMGKEIDDQNQLIDRLGGKVCRIHMSAECSVVQVR